MAFIISICHEKGGVGKSTSARELGSALSDAGKILLLIDLDTQGGLSKLLGEVPESFSAEETILPALLTGDRHIPVGRLARGHPLLGLHFIPANMNLATVGAHLKEKLAGNHSLKKALEPERDRYDYILLDCPKGGNDVLTLNALIAADGALVPMETEQAALTSLVQLQQVIDELREFYKPDFPIRILRTKYDGRRRHDREVSQAVQDQYPDETLSTIIPRAVAFPDSVDGKGIIHTYPEHAGAHAYRVLAEEIIKVWPSNEKA